MRRALRLALLAASLLAVPGHHARAADPVDENQVKAAVIYNLLLFVQWPAQAPPAGNFRFCLLADGALATALRRHEGKAVQGQSLEIHRLGSLAEDLDRCVAVMVEAGNPGALQRLRVQARSRALLVIAEGIGAMDNGAMIGLHTDGGRVTFDINHGAMKRSGLMPSSKILRLARTLIE